MKSWPFTLTKNKHAQTLVRYTKKDLELIELELVSTFVRTYVYPIMDS